jgi:hypothetical protein
MFRHPYREAPHCRDTSPSPCRPSARRNSGDTTSQWATCRRQPSRHPRRRIGERPWPRGNRIGWPDSRIGGQTRLFVGRLRQFLGPRAPIETCRRAVHFLRLGVRPRSSPQPGRVAADCGTVHAQLLRDPTLATPRHTNLAQQVDHLSQTKQGPKLPHGVEAYGQDTSLNDKSSTISTALWQCGQRMCMGKLQGKSRWSHFPIVDGSRNCHTDFVGLGSLAVADHAPLNWRLSVAHLSQADLRPRGSRLGDRGSSARSRRTGSPSPLERIADLIQMLHFIRRQGRAK